MNQNQGVTVEHDLKGLAIAKVTLEYRGRAVPLGMASIEIECEIYKADGILSVHTVCPRCRRAQWIDGRNKSVELSGDALYVEAFECPWELGDDDDHRHFGIGLCRLKLAYDGKIARDV